MKETLLIGCGGGLGDIFWYIYHGSEWQSTQFLIDQYSIDCVCYSSNNKVYDILDSIYDTNGNKILRNIYVLDLFLDKEKQITLKNVISSVTNCIDCTQPSGWEFMRKVIPDLFDTYGYRQNNIYNFDYKMSYFDNEFFQNHIKDRKYIVIHPSGGTQKVDGITRDEYPALLNNLDSNMEFIVLGASHTRLDTKAVDMIENNINTSNGNIIDLTNKASLPLSANIVKNSLGVIGSHSCWLNMAWDLGKPTICILSNNTDWGDGESYIKTNGCRWGFSLNNSRIVINKTGLNDVISEVIECYTIFQ